MVTVEALTAGLLQVLELLGIVLALFAVVVILLGVARSIIRLTFSNAVLILPFRGGENAGALHYILTEQLSTIEDEARAAYRFLLKEVELEPPASSNSLADVGPLSSTALHDLVGDPQAIHRAKAYIAEDPVNLTTMDTISLAGITISPQSIFAVSYYLRRRFARTTLKGSIDNFGDTVRLALTTSVGWSRRNAKKETRGNRAPVLAGPIVIERRVVNQNEVLELLNDVAFRILRLRFELTSETERWSAWLAFQRAYAEHVAFVRNGDRDRRDRAIEAYSKCVAIDPSFARAHYNLGNLLYDQYLLSANHQAIEHFTLAAHSNDTTVRALAHAGLTMAYAQNVHRYELESTRWIERAIAAAKVATSLKPDLEEVAFAWAWSLQISERIEDAIHAYEDVLAIPGGSPSEMRIKSFALNNEAWLYMTKLNDLTKAEELLQRALAHPNKNVYANLGEVRRRQGKFDDALAMYGEAIALDPLYANGLNETGMVLLAMAREERRNSTSQIKVLERAYNYHFEALRAVSDAAEKLRLMRNFDKFRRQIGLSRRSVGRWVRASRRIASVPPAAAGEHS